MLIDIHTHSPNEKAGISLVDASLQNVAALRPDNVLYSMGIHPCNIPENWKENAETIREALRKHQIAAIGECGFDRTSPFPLEMQREVFDRLSKISAEANSPIIIHCVRAADVLLQYSNRMPAPGMWIVHGFRGKPEAMRQLLNAGYSISFGQHFNAESLKACPAERIFVETDTASHDVLTATYRQCREMRGGNPETDIEQNFVRLFQTFVRRFKTEMPRNAKNTPPCGNNV